MLSVARLRASKTYGTISKPIAFPERLMTPVFELRNVAKLPQNGKKVSQELDLI